MGSRENVFQPFVCSAGYVDSLFRVQQAGAGLFNIDSARFRQCHDFGVAHKQDHAQLLFKQDNLFAQGGYGDVEFLRCPAIVQFLGKDNGSKLET